MDDSPSKMRIFELYLGRLIQEYDLIWQRFKVFAGMNTLLLLGISYLITVNNIKKLSDILENPGLHFFINLLTTAGIIITLAWIMITWGSYQWISLMNDILKDMEKEIFFDASPEFFKKITRNKSRSEIVNFNIGLSISFIITWGMILFIMTHISS